VFFEAVSKMPGVLIDEHHPFGLDYLNHNGIGGGGSGSTYDVGGYFSSTSFLHNTQSATQQHAMRRLNTFSSVGLQDSEAAQSAPHVYQRSHSFGNTGSLQQAFHLMGSSNNSAASSVTKPDLGGGGGGLSLLDGGGLVDDSSCSFGDGSAKWVLETGLDGTTKMGRCGGSSGSSSSSDLRSSPLSFGGGGSAMMMMSSGCSPLVGSPTFCDSLHSFNKFLPSNNEDEEAWTVVDTYGCDQFRMFEFKVRRCMRGRSHDWTECPFAHPGEKARRRDPRRFHYSGTACPDFRKGSCRRGDACEYAHGVFECWLHPARYRTQPCKDGRNCRRRVCFFAHTPEQLRLLPAAAQAATVAARSAAGGGGLVASEAAASPRGGGVYDGAPVYEGNAFDGSSSPAATHAACSPLSHFNGLMTSAALSGHVCFPSQISSPTSTLVGHAHSPPSLSPPLSPSGSPPHSPSTTHGWPNSMASSFSGLSTGQAAMSQAYTQAALARSQSSQGMGIGAHPHSPPVPGHRRHLDRLNSMPTLSIPSGDHRSMQHQAVGLPGSAPVSPAVVGQQRNSMMELIATLQQLELRGGSASPNGTTQWLQQQQQHYSSEPSPLRRSSLGVVGTPPNHVQWEQKESWEVDENEEGEPTVQRVESGRGLRAKIYGRLGKELPIEAGNADVPDLGWINELVKEEPEQQQTPPGEGT